MSFNVTKDYACDNECDIGGEWMQYIATSRIDSMLPTDEIVIVIAEKLQRRQQK